MMEEITRHIKKMQVITRRKELVRGFLTTEVDEEHEEVGDSKDKPSEQDQHFLISQLLVRDEDLEDEARAEVKNSKALKPYSGNATDDGNGEMLLTGETPSQPSTASTSCDTNVGQINEAILTQTFPQLFQHICDMFSNVKDEGEIRKAFLAMNITGPYFYCFAQLNKHSSRKYCTKLFTEKHNEYEKNRDQIPDLDTLIFFKLVLFVYPAFLVSHPLTTSCLTFMSKIVTTCRFDNAYSISRGLFVCTLISEYTILSKRNYVPVAVNFLKGILFLSVKSTALNPVPPFGNDKILILEEDCSKLDAGMKMSVLDLLKDSIDNEFKIRMVLISVLLLGRFFERVEMRAQKFMFKDHIRLLNSLELKLYPERVVNSVKGFVRCVKGT